MAGDLQPNESQCRVFAESSVVSGDSYLLRERNVDTECDTSLRLVCLRGGCVLLAAWGEAEGRIRPSAGAKGLLCLERAEAREKSM